MGINEALIKAGRIRLRPILMTSLALIAGTLPIAIGVTANRMVNGVIKLSNPFQSLSFPYVQEHYAILAIIWFMQFTTNT